MEKDEGQKGNALKIKQVLKGRQGGINITKKDKTRTMIARWEEKRKSDRSEEKHKQAEKMDNGGESSP